MLGQMPWTQVLDNTHYMLVIGTIVLVAYWVLKALLSGAASSSGGDQQGAGQRSSPHVDEATAIRCPKCGREFGPNARFCSHCEVWLR